MKLNIKLYFFLLMISANTFAEDNTYFIFDSTTFNDDFSNSRRISVSLGREYAGYLIYTGASAIVAKDSKSDSRQGWIFGANKKYSKSLRMKSKVSIYENIGILGQLTLFGDISDNQSYYLQCQKNIVDNYASINSEISYKGCNISYEMKIDDLGIVGDYAKYNFSDGNEKDIKQAKIYYDVNDRLRFSGTRKETRNDLDSPFYFSPSDWQETYASVEVTAFRSKDMTHKVDIGYGEENIDGFDRTPVRLGYTGFFDINEFSMRLRLESRINSNYTFFWSGIDLTYRY